MPTGLENEFSVRESVRPDAGVSDNEAWKAERPGQQVVARSELVATVARIVARARAAL